MHISKQLLTAGGNFTAIVLDRRQCLASFALHWFHERANYGLALHAHGVFVAHAFRALGLPGFADLLGRRSNVSAGRDSRRGRLTVATPLTFMGSPLGPVQPWTVQTDVSVRQ